MTHHLAQVNIALAREPLDAPLLADFMAALEPVNAAADAAPGFVWRLQDASGDATGIRGFGGGDRLIVNLTVWTSLEALRAFTYEDPQHLAVMRRRRGWFERLALHAGLWWVPAGHLPDVPEAEARMAHLAEHGPTPHAFGFPSAFPAPGAPTEPEAEVEAGAAGDDDRWLCPA